MPRHKRPGANSGRTRSETTVGKSKWPSKSGTAGGRPSAADAAPPASPRIRFRLTGWEPGHITLSGKDLSKTLPEIQPSPWFFQEPPTDFDAALVMQWVGQFIKPYNR